MLTIPDWRQQIYPKLGQPNELTMYPRIMPGFWPGCGQTIPAAASHRHIPFQNCIVRKSCRALFWASAIDVGLHPFGILPSHPIGSGLVAECHQRCLAVVDVQRPVQSVSVVVFGVVIQTVIVSYLVLDAPVEPFQFAIGLRTVWSRVD